MLRLLALAGLAIQAASAQILAEQKEEWCYRAAGCYATSSECAVDYCHGPPGISRCTVEGPFPFEPFVIPIRNDCCSTNNPYACYQQWIASHKSGPGDGTLSATIAPSSSAKAASTSGVTTATSNRAATSSAGSNKASTSTGANKASTSSGSKAPSSSAIASKSSAAGGASSSKAASSSLSANATVASASITGASTAPVATTVSVTSTVPTVTKPSGSTAASTAMAAPTALPENLALYLAAIGLVAIF